MHETALISTCCKGRWRRCPTNQGRARSSSALAIAGTTMGRQGHSSPFRSPWLATPVHAAR
jgi:hypothetical protein